jgi:hypothetical protein
MVGGKSNWVSFKDEKLSLFCFRCGCVVHSSKGCPAGTQWNMSDGDAVKEWGGGVWLRVEASKR